MAPPSTAKGRVLAPEQEQEKEAPANGATDDVDAEKGASMADMVRRRVQAFAARRERVEE
jgi:hypothetical protein